MSELICGDARHFTSYLSTCVHQKKITGALAEALDVAKVKGNLNSNEFKEYLQTNGPKVREFLSSVPPSPVCTCNF